MELIRKQDDDRFWQKLILPEEDRRRLYPGEPWKGGYRWFRSPNIVCLEKYRRLRINLGAYP
jgi:hypothetical protein